ncbi:hypothetical protein EK904_011656 [Melospiza melodia maxima]|nr:hypothetical protein EK904_011656 [Melospiza melodia maxima]
MEITSLRRETLDKIPSGKRATACQPGCRSLCPTQAPLGREEKLQWAAGNGRSMGAAPFAQLETIFCNFDEGKSLLFLHLVTDVVSHLEDKGKKIKAKSENEAICTGNVSPQENLKSKGSSPSAAKLAMQNEPRDRGQLLGFTSGVAAKEGPIPCQEMAPDGPRHAAGAGGRSRTWRGSYITWTLWVIPMEVSSAVVEVQRFLTAEASAHS